MRTEVTDSPLVSILMPAHNEQQFIEASVASVWAQDYRPLELIVVDDGSADATPSLLKTLKNRSPLPMQVVLSDRCGMCAALNQALSLATGKYVGIAHADDILRVDRIRQQVKVIEANNNAVLVHSNYVAINKEGLPTGSSSHEDRPPASGWVLRDVLLGRVDVRSMTMLMRRSTMEAIGGYDERYPNEDWQSILRLCTQGTVLHVPESLVYRRVHGANESVAGVTSRSFSEYDIAYDILKEVTPDDLDLEYIAARSAAVVLKNSVAVGAWKRAWGAGRWLWDNCRRFRLTIARAALRGLTSLVWLRFIRPWLPKPLRYSLLRLKRSWLSWRSRTSQK